MSDLIDRYEVIELLKRMRYEADSKREREMITDTENRINAMPSVEPKKGKWIPHSERCLEYIGTILVYVRYDYWFCDACGYRVEKGRPMYNYCPNCGARMED